MIVERFLPEHLQALILQPAQEYMRAAIVEPKFAEQIAQTDAYTAFIDGRVVWCGGVARIWEGRGDAWSLIARDIGPAGMHSLHYWVRGYLDSLSFHRIEAACDAAFAQAHRWLVLLDFKYEGPLRKYTRDGRDCLRFARVK